MSDKEFIDHVTEFYMVVPKNRVKRMYEIAKTKRSDVEDARILVKRACLTEKKICCLDNETKKVLKDPNLTIEDKLTGIKLSKIAFQGWCTIYGIKNKRKGRPQKIKLVETTKQEPTENTHSVEDEALTKALKTNKRIEHLRSTLKIGQRVWVDEVGAVTVAAKSRNVFLATNKESYQYFDISRVLED